MNPEISLHIALFVGGLMVGMIAVLAWFALLMAAGVKALGSDIDGQ